MTENKNKKVSLKTVKLSEVPKEERVQFFLDYYLKETLIIIGVIAFLVYIIWSMSRPKVIDILNITVFDESIEINKISELEQDIYNKLDVEEVNAKVTIDNNFYSSSKGVEKLQIYVTGGGVDILIAPEETFEKIAQLGYFEIVTDDFNKGFYTNGFDDTNTDNGVGKGERACYGIYIGDNEKYKEAGGRNTDAVMGFLLNSENKDYSEKFVDIVFN